MPKVKVEQRISNRNMDTYQAKHDAQDPKQTQILQYGSMVMDLLVL